MGDVAAKIKNSRTALRNVEKSMVEHSGDVLLVVSEIK
jgi:hypothetical protein